MPAVISTLMCHAPIVVPAVGGSRGDACAASTAAMRKAARRVVEARPDVVVLTSPHAPRVPQAFTVVGGPRVKGDFAEFGASAAAIDLPAAVSAREVLREIAASHGVRIDEIVVRRLDHGSLVPLSFLVEAGWHGPTVVLGLPRAPDARAMHALGRAIAEASGGARWAMVASGDCSHRLIPGAPAGFHPEAKRFDESLRHVVASGDDHQLDALDEELRDLAAEDAVDTLQIAAAATAFTGAGREVLSYEGPFGVGYLVAVLHDDSFGGRAAARSPSAAEAGARVLLDVARDALRARLLGGERIEIGCHVDGGPYTGCFVTWRRPDGELRGCVGRMSLDAPLVDTVAEMAVSAARSDPRFDPVTADELGQLEPEVSLLMPLVPVHSPAELDPKVWGVDVRSGWRHGVLLPDIDGVDTVDDQLRIVLQKAGISPHEPFTLSKFRVRKVSAEKSHEREHDQDAR